MNKPPTERYTATTEPAGLFEGEFVGADLEARVAIGDLTAAWYDREAL